MFSIYSEVMTVALDFTKLVPLVSQMGRSMAKHNLSLSQRVEIAVHHFDNLPSNRHILSRVKLARVNDAGYRGVAPISGESEPLNAIFACPSTPPQATIIATDGSQIYPDLHSAVFYYLINIGVFTYYHGGDHLPDQFTEPQLFYTYEDTHDRSGNLIKNAVVNAQRAVRELELLAENAAKYHTADYPVLAIYDGPLLFWLGQDVQDAERIEADYHRALHKLNNTHIEMQFQTGGSISLIGYTDRPSSRFFMAMLHLLTLEDEDVKRNMLEIMGDYEGLTDYWLFREILLPGERSALMIQQSPQNKSYKNEVGVEYEIAFFYVNVARHGFPVIARVELPMWVAQSAELVNTVHSLVVSQSEIMGSYPYALTRADELAVVRSAEKQTLEDLIRTELLKNQQPVEESSKLIGKHQTRSERRRFGDTHART
jgi:hypothetical protein